MEFSGALGELVTDIKRYLPRVFHEQSLDTKKRTSFIHADLSPFNILFDGSRLWLIDWETAGYGNPLYDVATIMSLMLIQPKARQEFLKRYFGREATTEENRAIFVNMITALICFGSFSLELAHKQAWLNRAQPSFSQEYSLSEVKKAVANIHDGETQVQIGAIFFLEARRLIGLLYR